MQLSALIINVSEYTGHTKLFAKFDNIINWKDICE